MPTRTIDMHVTRLREKLRDDPAEQGLQTTVSGMLSKPGLAVWSATPPAGCAMG